METTQQDATTTLTAAPTDNKYNLTPREIDIAWALTQAMRNRDIATHFGISEYTVKHHISNIFNKIGCDSRLELVTFIRHHDITLIPSKGVA